MSAYSDSAVFVRVGESRSFVRAAKALALTPSAVSKAVSRLERRLGARLIVRSTRSLRVTELGAEYFERCRDAFERIERADISIADASMQGTGLLRVEVPPTIGRHSVVPALARYVGLHPNIQVHVMFSDRPTDPFRDEVDAAIRIGSLPPSELIARRVGELRWLTCASPSFISRYGSPSSPEALEPQQCLGLIEPQSRGVTPWNFRQDASRSSVTPSSRLALTDVDAAIAAATCGLGFVQAPDLALQSHIDRGELQVVLTDWEDDARSPAYVVYPNHRQRSVRIKSFVEFLQTILPQGDGCVAR